MYVDAEFVYAPGAWCGGGEEIAGGGHVLPTRSSCSVSASMARYSRATSSRTLAISLVVSTAQDARRETALAILVMSWTVSRSGIVVLLAGLVDVFGAGTLGD